VHLDLNLVFNISGLLRVGLLAEVVLGDAACDGLALYEREIERHVSKARR